MICLLMIFLYIYINDENIVFSFFVNICYELNDSLINRRSFLDINLGNIEIS